MKSSKLWKFYNCIYQDGKIQLVKNDEGGTNLIYMLLMNSEFTKSVQKGLLASVKPDFNIPVIKSSDIQ